MKNSTFHFTVLLFPVITVVLIGCYSSSRSVTQFSDLEKAYVEGESIRVLTLDSTLYTFDSFSFSDSTLYGEGRRKYKKATVNFQGTIPISEIVFIERLKSNGWKAFWLVPMSAAVIGGMATLMEPSEFTIRRSGSCPFIYSYDGSEFVLEAEAFSTAISKVLETQTFHLLPSVESTGGEVKVRITNERPETHIFNSVKLFAVDAQRAPSVVMDTENNVWAVHNARMPASARDHSGNDILDTIKKRDGTFWKSGMEDISLDSDFRDKVEVQFELPQEKPEATMIVDAINSELITEVYSAAGAIIGEESLMFYRALEQDTVLQNFFLSWIRKSSLLIEIADGDGWKEVGTLLPEANMVPFTRAIRLENLEDYESPLTIRFSSMTDVWHIDALSVDYSNEAPLAMQPLEMISVNPSNKQEGFKKAISNSDSLYAMTLPPDYMDLTFDATAAGKMQNPSYILAAEGYLYEWFPEAGDLSASGISDLFEGVEPGEMLAFFTQREDLFLHSIYARWSRKNR